IAELETHLSRHKLAEHKEPRRRKSSRRSSPVDEILGYQNAPNIQELKAISPTREPGRGSEYQVLSKQSVDNSVLWPGSNLDPPPNLREQHSLPFITDFF